MYFMPVLFLLGWEGHVPSHAQELLLGLYFEVTPGCAQGTMGCYGLEQGFTRAKVAFQTLELSLLRPHLFISIKPLSQFTGPLWHYLPHLTSFDTILPNQIRTFLCRTSWRVQDCVIAGLPQILCSFELVEKKG